jgi:branched-chain amino acid transport system substrate-binding protein
MADINIGFAAPLSGSNAALGEQLRNGVEHAIEDVNAQGGSLGQKYTLRIGDDVSDPKQGIMIANRFGAEGVRIVVAHYNSGVAIPSSEVYADLGILMISPGATAAAVTDRKLWNVFRTVNRDDDGTQVAALYLARHFSQKRIAIVHDKTPAGEGLASGVQKNLHGHGIKEILYDSITIGEKDYSALVSKLKANHIDLIYYGGAHTEAGLIVRQMKDQNLKIQMMSGSGIATLEFAAIAGPAAEGTLMVFADDASSNPNAKAVVDRFKTKNIDPESYTLYAYIAIQILKQAIDSSQSTDPRTLAQLLHSGKRFKTILGDVAFDEKGDIDIKNILYIWRKTESGKMMYKPV